jgi:N-methylhydantoinase A
MLLGVDVGGTFTDAVLVGASGALHTAKVPSTPDEQSVAVLAAVGLVLERAGAEPQELERFAHGMTVATNALLEGRTARTALIATEGFTDVIELGRQARPHLYELCRSAPPPLVPHELRLAAPERIGIDGPLRSLDPGAARSVIARLAGLQPEAVAVALLHSYADPSHERLLGGLLAELLPEVHVTLSSDLVGTFREFERTATTVLDAALSPLLGSYLRRLSREARAGSLPEPQVMQSSGGLTSAGRAAKHAALTVLSGPAGGVAGAELLAQLATERDVICFDMGGTSCDVCVIEDGEVAETATREIAGRPLALPALDIHTVGAGGGSIAWRDSGGALRVGPSSAGAEPGPACYGRGGLLPTVTDANLLLGRLLPDTPLAGQIELDRGAAERAVSALGAELALDVTSCAEGIVRVAEWEMLGALRLMTIERGIDPRGFALMPFGGAGALHAAALADELGITRILCPRASGVLCALGLAAARPRRDVSRTVLLSGSSLTAARLAQESEALIEEASEALGASPSRVRVLHELRYRAQSYELPIEVSGSAGPAELREAFGRAHELRYGYRDDAEEVELVTLRVSVWGTAPALPLMASTAAEQPAARLRRIVLAGETIDVRVLRGELPPGTRLEGPALCALPEATMLIAPGWEGEVDAHGTARLSRVEGRP